MCELLHTSLVSKKCQSGQKPCANWQLVWVWAPQDHKDRLLFRRRLEHFAQRREVEQRVGRRAVARRGADPSHAGMG